MRRWHAIGLFCEDVRENGSSLTGILPDNIEVPKVPAMMGKIGIYVRVNLDPEDNIKSVTAKIKFPDGSEASLGGFTADTIERTRRDLIDKGAPWVGLIITGVATPFPIQKTGRLSIVVIVDDQEIICGSLNVVEGHKPQDLDSGTG
jgi:hypothetical protein